MILPFSDDNPCHQTPYVSYGILGLCVAVFLYQIGLPQEALRQFIFTFGFQPGAFFGDESKAFSPTLSLFSSMFMHGGFMHLAGNMLYLWIFADNIEAAMGRGRFIVFYLLTGLVAALSHGVLSPDSMTPMVGASGAISGVLGAYLLMYPKANIRIFVMFYFFWQTINVPAYLVLGGWFLMQFLGAANADAGEAGVAFMAHIGGFVAGLVLVKFFIIGREHLFHERHTRPWEVRTQRRTERSTSRADDNTPTIKARGPLGRRRRKGPWT